MEEKDKKFWKDRMLVTLLATLILTLAPGAILALIFGSVGFWIWTSLVLVLCTPGMIWGDIVDHRFEKSLRELPEEEAQARRDQREGRAKEKAAREAAEEQGLLSKNQIRLAKVVGAGYVGYKAGKGIAKW